MCISRVHILGRMQKMLRTVTSVERYQCMISTYNMYRVYYAMDAPPKGVIHGVFVVWRNPVLNRRLFSILQESREKGKREEER
ncbi:hypothetical protein DWW31_00445 [Clostridium sp. AF15-17LB]|nr:hypothetical protein DWW31_00445 [Clostridium sp. AF15-17LB]